MPGTTIEPTYAWGKIGQERPAPAICERCELQWECQNYGNREYAAECERTQDARENQELRLRGEL